MIQNSCRPTLLLSSKASPFPEQLALSGPLLTLLGAGAGACWSPTPTSSCWGSTLTATCGAPSRCARGQGSGGRSLQAGLPGAVLLPAQGFVPRAWVMSDHAALAAPAPAAGPVQSRDGDIMGQGGISRFCLQNRRLALWCYWLRGKEGGTLGWPQGSMLLASASSHMPACRARELTLRACAGGRPRAEPGRRHHGAAHRGHHDARAAALLGGAQGGGRHVGEGARGVRASMSCLDGG